MLMVGIIGSCIRNIIEDFFPIQAITLRNRKEADRAEGTFCVNV
jgi:hypothetical protein